MKTFYALIVLSCISCTTNECSVSVSYKSNVEAVMYRHQNGMPSEFFEIEKCYPRGIHVEFYDNGIISSYGYHSKGGSSSSEWLIYDTTGVLRSKQYHKNGVVKSVSTLDGKVTFLTDADIIMNSTKKKLHLMNDTITYARRSDLKIYYNHDTVIFESGRRKFKLDTNLNILTTQNVNLSY